MLSQEVIACFNLEFMHLLEPKVQEQAIGSSEIRKSKKRKTMKLEESDLLAADVELAIGRNSDDPQTRIPMKDTYACNLEGNARQECLGLMEMLILTGGASITGMQRQMMEKSVGKVTKALVHDKLLALPAAKLLLASVLSPCEHRPRLLPMVTYSFSSMDL